MFKSNYQHFIIHLHMHAINLTEEIRVANATVKCKFWINPFLNRRLNVGPLGSWIYSLIRAHAKQQQRMYVSYPRLCSPVPPRAPEQKPSISLLRVTRVAS